MEKPLTIKKEIHDLTDEISGLEKKEAEIDNSIKNAKKSLQSVEKELKVLSDLRAEKDPEKQKGNQAKLDEYENKEPGLLKDKTSYKSEIDKLQKELEEVRRQLQAKNNELSEKNNLKNIEYKVTFEWVDDDGEIHEKAQQVKYGTDAKPPKNPERTSQKFDGWDSDYTNVTEDRTIKAKWKPKTPISPPKPGERAEAQSRIKTPPEVGDKLFHLYFGPLEVVEIRYCKDTDKDNKLIAKCLDYDGIVETGNIHDIEILKKNGPIMRRPEGKEYPMFAWEGENNALGEVLWATKEDAKKYSLFPRSKKPLGLYEHSSFQSRP